MIRNQECEVARRWWALPRNIWLPLLPDGYCQVCFTGRPGGSAGPDVRDAVLRFVYDYPTLPTQEAAAVAGAQTAVLTTSVGAVEFHVRATDWEAHQHQYDVRYNTVLLHVVLYSDTCEPTLREDGQQVPICSLQDVVIQRPDLLFPGCVNYEVMHSIVWPCQRVLQHLQMRELERLLTRAGMLRFEEKAHAFVEQLHAIVPYTPFDRYDACLLPALLEGLGYGRDRTLFRVLGRQFVQGQGALSVLDAALCQLPALDALRVHAFCRLYLRWQRQGCWSALKSILLAHDAPAGSKVDGWNYTTCRRALLAALHTTGLGPARSDIVLCNVVLPFALAVATIEHDSLLARRAEALYRAYPGLPSNHITRAMCSQLQLFTEPHSACQQQGLHYIYQSTCREKRCDLCIMGRSCTLS